MCATNTRYGAMIRTSGIQLLRAMHRASRVLVVLACVWATVALAVPPEQVASSLARRALQLDEAGDPVQAAALYLEAFRTDPTQPNYLYAAARAEMSAGKTASAEEHFEQFLGLVDPDLDRADKARAYLADLRGSRAGSKESEADAAAAAGRWSEASQLYEALWNQMPTRWSALFKAGQTAQQGGAQERANELLRQYLRDAPRSAADRPEAEECLQRLEGGHTAIDVHEQAARGDDKNARTLGWTMLGTGIALVAGGAGLLLYGVSEEQALSRDLKLVDGYVTADLSHAQAQARADAIGMHESLGVGFTAAGVVAAGVGTWLLLRENPAPARSRVTVAPGPAWAGASLSWRF